METLQEHTLAYCLPMSPTIFHSCTYEGKKKSKLTIQSEFLSVCTLVTIAKRCEEFGL